MVWGLCGDSCSTLHPSPPPPQQSHGPVAACCGMPFPWGTWVGSPQWGTPYTVPGWCCSCVAPSPLAVPLGTEGPTRWPMFIAAPLPRPRLGGVSGLLAHGTAPALRDRSCTVGGRLWVIRPPPWVAYLPTARRSAPAPRGGGGSVGHLITIVPTVPPLPQGGRSDMWVIGSWSCVLS